MKLKGKYPKPDKVTWLFIFMFLVIVGSMAFASAAEWDNVLRYSEEDLKVELENWFGLGVNYGSAELKSHVSVDEWRGVSNNDEAAMWYLFNFTQIYEGGLGNVKFIDMNTGKSVERNYKFIYQTTEMVDVYNYTNCGNKDYRLCPTEIVGKEERIVWKDYIGRDIPKEEIIIGIKVDLRIGDTLDVVWEIGGKEVSRHAVIYYVEAHGVTISGTDTGNGAFCGERIQTNQTFSVYNVTLDAEDDGTHVAILWANYSYISENASLSGQTGTFASPIQLAANTEYFVVSTKASGNRACALETSGISYPYHGTTIQWLGSTAGLGSNYTNSIFSVDSMYVGISISPVIDLNYPIDNNDSIIQNIVFNVTGSASDSAPDNISLILNNSNNGTNTSIVNNSFTLFDRTLPDGAYNWTARICEADECVNATPRLLRIDSTYPNLNLTFPFGNIGLGSNPESLRWNVSDVNLDTCWYDYDFTNTTVTCGDNVTTFTPTAQRNITFWANDTFGQYSGNVSTWTSTGVENSVTANASSFETANESFVVNITSNGTALTGAYLWYDNTAYLGTITNTADDFYNLSATIDIPLTNETKNWLYNFSMGGPEVNTSTKSQIINGTTFVICDGSTTPVYYNLTFKNETASEEPITSTIDSDWYFWLGSGNVLKTYTFTNTSENANYSFCLTSGTNRTLSANISMDYTNSISEERSFSSNLTLTNQTTNKTLYLLPTSEGIFVSFQVVDSADQIISGVSSNVTKSGDLIATGTTDDSGIVQYFLDPDTTYSFNFYKSGYPLGTTSLVPTQTTYTITLGSLSPTLFNDTTKGISYSISPTANYLANGTNTEFNLTFYSGFWSLDNYGFSMKNSTGNVFNTTSDTSTSGGNLGVILNTGNNTNLIMEVFWTINGNQTNFTRIWGVLDTSDEGYSIKNFFNRVSTYLNSGIFGLTSWGLSILVFLAITMIVGIVGWKAGFSTNSAGIWLVAIFLVIFFDVGLNLIPGPGIAGVHFISILSVMIGIFIIVREVKSR